MPTGFNLLAPVYDRLASLVFGKAIGESQQFYFAKLQPKAHVLVAGGGTGAFLPELHRYHPGARIDFVEKSEAMVRKATLAMAAGQTVNFIVADFREFKADEKYDLVLLPFFLDMFSDTTVSSMVAQLAGITSAECQIVVTDFVSQRKATWQRGLLGATYLFFRLLCSIEATQLPDWQRLFSRNRWNIVAKTTYFSGMIGSYLLSRDK